MDPPAQISDEQLEDIVLRGKVTALMCRLHGRAPPLVIFSFCSCRLLSSLASWQRKIREHLARSLLSLLHTIAVMVPQIHVHIYRSHDFI